ncbi:hypothetical protein [Edaphobacter bradus]|uniref:hypothetical protein n=1 Tax=Edaphobacter bradus TaxID=2259016 RepID=UPI0021E04901|nr:hypothetical protein [Edaphobacter bradus]
MQLEIPFEADPSHKIDSAQRGAISSLAGLYVTPSLRVRFLNGQRISPWLSSGFGYGLYEGSKALNNGEANPNRFRNTPTAQFGGGVDFRTPIRIVFPISLRIEVRDYYTLNVPNF